MAPEQDRSETDSPGEGTTAVSRRSYLAIAGAAVASAAGLAGGERDAVDVPAATRPVTTYGYGGGPVVRERSLSAATAATASLAAASVAESEPNDTMGEATLVSTGATASGTLESAGVDWWAVDLAAGDRLDVTVERAADTGVVAAATYDPNGDNLDVRYVGSGQPTTIDVDSAPTSGRHYVELVDVQQGDGDYALQFGDGSGSSTATPTPTPTPTSTPTPTATPTPTPTATPTPTPTPTPTASDESQYGVQGYGQLGYGGTSN